MQMTSQVAGFTSESLAGFRLECMADFVGICSENAAEAQLSIRYGHIALSFLPAYAMTRSWENFEPWLGYDS